MPLTAIIGTAIGQSNYEIIRDQITAILAVEFALQKASFGLPADLLPTFKTERYINIDESEFPIVNTRMFTGSYLDEDGRPTADSSGNRFGTYRYYIDVYTGSPSNNDSFGDELAAKALQRIIGIVMAILEDTRYSTLGFDPEASGISGTYIEHFSVMEAGENENQIDYIRGRVVFVVKVPEQVALPSPRSLLMTTVTVSMAGQNEIIYTQLLQMQISITNTSDTLDNAFFSNPVLTLELLDGQNRTVATYTVDVDFTITGTVATATTFTFTAGQTFVAKT